jgi:CDGSH-type Zn-finger protein
MPDEVTVRINNNGPIVIEGPIRIVDSEGNAFSLPADKNRFFLCRCGQSGNAPFCDGQHKQCGFVSVVRAE